MKSTCTVLSLGLVLLVVTSAFGAIAVTPTGDATTLANTILGGGVTILNPVYSGVAEASGTFTGGLSAGIGIDQGIIMTSGWAAGAVGPNNSDGYSIGNGTPGNANLSALIGGAQTNDAAVLDFDFTTTGGDVFFNYVFASEEYNEYVYAFNDVFGFFLDGVNIALIPGTTLPVSIDNVNGGKPLGTNASHPEFYNNNDPSDGTPTFDIQYDGFTDVFTAQVLGLTPGTHHIQLAIADALDYALDSAVFIQAGSFSDEPTPTVPEPATIVIWSLLGGLAFAAGSWRRRNAA
jgi:hypothetical protein